MSQHVAAVETTLTLWLNGSAGQQTMVDDS